jgi:hypothetical protein
MFNFIVALPKKLVICEKQTPNFIGFERLELKHSESDTRLNGQTLSKK